MATGNFLASRRGLAVGLTCFTVLIAGILMVALKGKGAAADEEDAKPDLTVEVKTAKVEQRDIAERALGPGVVFPKDQATVSAKISAPIARLARLEGKAVQEGQVLAVLESKDLAASESEAAAGVAQAEAAAERLASGVQPGDLTRAEAEASTAEATLANARRICDRKRALAEAGALPQRDLDDAELALKAAENQAHTAEENLRLLKSQVGTKDLQIARAQVEAAHGHLAAAQANHSYSQIVAPISGVVTEQKLYQGEMATADAPILTIMQVDQVVVRARFPERVVAKMKVGDMATVVPGDGNDDEVVGTVNLIIPAVDLSTRTIEVWIAVQNHDLRLKPGAAVQASVTTRVDKQALAIPASAIQVDDSGQDKAKVAVVESGAEGDTAKLVDVETGIRDGDAIEIVQGLSAGQVVVVEGNYGLEDGTKIHAADGDGDDAAADGKTAAE